jgi:hypothetical protein
MTTLNRTLWFARQVRRDEAWRWLPLWMLVTALTTSALLGGCYAQAVRRHQPPSLALLESVVWLALAIYLAFGRVGFRCSRLDLTLPVPARRLWLAHLTAVLLSGAAVAGASVGVVILVNGLMGKIQPIRAAELDLSRMVALLGTGLVMAVSLLETRKPGLRSIPMSRWAALWRASVLAGVLVLTVVLAELPLAWLLIPLAFALAVGFGVYRSLPATFALLPLEPDDGEPAARRQPPELSELPPERARRFHSLLFWILQSHVKFGPATPWVAYSLLALLGVVLSGVFGIWMGSDDLRFLYIPFATYMLLAFVGPGMSQLHQLDPLPISRRLLFGVLMLPSLLALVAGYGAGRIALAVLEKPTDLVEYRIDERGMYVWVPERYLEVTWNGEPPALHSAWGESHPAWSVPLFRGSRARMYSPFIAAEESSAPFEALMVSRAVESVYGAPVPHAEILDRYFRVEGDRLTGLQEGGLTLREDYSQLVPLDTGPAFPLLMVLTGVPWLLLVALFLRTYRAGVAGWVRQAAMWGPLILLLALMVVPMVAALKGWVRPWVVRGLVEILTLDLGQTVVGTLAAWGSSALLLLAAYWLAQAGFLRIEVPAQPTKFTLIEWMREEK